jgi:hypothetical protein
MKNQNISRSFVYRSKPEEIKDFLTINGYLTKEIYDQKGNHIIGFMVINTTIKVSYSSTVRNPISGEPMTVGEPTVSIRNSPVTTSGDVQKAEKSLRLYRLLHRHFGK